MSTFIMSTRHFCSVKDNFLAKIADPSHHSYDLKAMGADKLLPLEIGEATTPSGFRKMFDELYKLAVMANYYSYFVNYPDEVDTASKLNAFISLGANPDAYKASLSEQAHKDNGDYTDLEPADVINAVKCMRYNTDTDSIVQDHEVCGINLEDAYKLEIIDEFLTWMISETALFMVKGQLEAAKVQWAVEQVEREKNK